MDSTRYMDDYTAPNRSTSALLTIDVQNDFVRPGAPAEIPGTNELLPAMQDLLAAFRENGRPVIHVVRLYKPDGSNAELCRRRLVQEWKLIVSPGSCGAELVDELKCVPTAKMDSQLLLSGRLQEVGPLEWLLYKPRWGAFYSTALESHLKSIGVDTLVIAGCNFPNCPRTTIYEASERDFRVVLVQDAVSGLYDKGREEMSNIGVHLMNVEECSRWIGSEVESSSC